MAPELHCLPCSQGRIGCTCVTVCRSHGRSSPDKPCKTLKWLCRDIVSAAQLLYFPQEPALPSRSPVSCKRQPCRHAPWSSGIACCLPAIQIHCKPMPTLLGDGKLGEQGLCSMHMPLGPLISGKGVFKSSFTSLNGFFMLPSLA